MKYVAPQLQAAGTASQLIQTKTVMVSDDKQAFRPTQTLSTMLEK